LTRLPFTKVDSASTIEEWELPLKSEETSGRFRYFQVSLHFTVGGFLQGRDDVLFGGGFGEFGDQVHQGHVRGRHPDGQPVQLALQVRDHQADSLGRARRRGNHVQGGCSCPAQVLMRKVQDDLVVRVAVDGIIKPFTIVVFVVEDFWRKAPGSWWYRRRWKPRGGSWDRTFPH